MIARRVSTAATGLALFALAAAVPAGPAAWAQGFGFAQFSAVVTASGVTKRSLGVKKSTRTGVGRYEIKFMRKVDKCAFVASLRGTGGGQVSIDADDGSHKVLKISTFNSSGKRANKPFAVLVSCS